MYPAMYRSIFGIEVGVLILRKSLLQFVTAGSQFSFS